MFMFGERELIEVPLWNDTTNTGNPGTNSFPRVGVAEIPFIRRGDSAYVIVEGPSWEEAEANAVALGGHLVTINDAEENAWIYNNFGIGKWIGLSDKESEGIYKWTSGEDFTFSNWAPGEPSNSGDIQDYVWIQYEPGLWDDLQNDPNVNLGIAEIPLAPNNAPIGTPTLNGDFKLGQTISIDASAIEDADNFEGWTPTYQYAWEVSGDNGTSWSALTSPDATDGDSSFTLTEEEVGKQIRGVVSYVDGYGTNEVVESGGEIIEANKASMPVIRGSSIYKQVEGPTWTEAEANSVKLGGHLATIGELSEDHFIWNSFKKQELSSDGNNWGYWIGLQRGSHSDENNWESWQWVSNEPKTNYQNSHFVPGITGEPNGGSSDLYVHVWGERTYRSSIME